MKRKIVMLLLTCCLIQPAAAQTNNQAASTPNHKSRNIGALYSNDMENQFLVDLTAPKTFDALLFVERTTAASKNAPN